MLKQKEKKAENRVVELSQVNEELDHSTSPKLIEMTNFFSLIHLTDRIIIDRYNTPSFVKT